MSVMSEGQAAQRLLENPLLKAAIAELRRETFEQWCAMPADRERDLLRMKLFVEAVSAFESTLISRIQAMEKLLYDESLKSKE